MPTGHFAWGLSSRTILVPMIQRGIHGKLVPGATVSLTRVRQQGFKGEYLLQSLSTESVAVDVVG